MERIGDRLVAQGAITSAQLEIALRRQRTLGGYLGQHLIDGGFVSRLDFYEALAGLWQLRRRDLVVDPPHPEVVAQVATEESIELDWVPCEITRDGAVVVATAVRPAPDLIAEIADHFGQRPVELVACTRRDLDAVLLRRRVEQAAREREQGTTSDRLVVEPHRYDRLTVRGVHHVAVGLFGVVGVVGIVLLPLDVVAVMVIIAAGLFLAGVSVQATFGLAAFSRELAEEAAGVPLRQATEAAVRAEDRDLPTYTVLVRLPRPSAVAEASALLASLDYPRSRLDAILLVDEDDDATLAALRAATPPEWVRVARLPASSAADRTAAYDHGLALARGRHVVVYRADERPEPGQLRQAAHEFDVDLEVRMGRSGGTPLLALSATRLLDSTRRSPYARLAGVDEGLRIGRESSEVPAGAVPRDLGSTHFSMRLLRRLGGFAAVHPALDGVLAGVERPRIEVMASVSEVARVPGPLVWTHERAQACVATVRVSLGRLRDALRTHPADRGAACHALLALSLPLMFFSLPVLIECAVVVALRSGMEPGTFAERAVWLGLGEAFMAMCGAASYVGMVLARRHGTRAVGDLVVFPFHWMLASAAMWAALLVLTLDQVAQWRAGRVRATAPSPVAGRPRVEQPV